MNASSIHCKFYVYISNYATGRRLSEMNVVWEKPRDTYADVPLGGVFAFIMSNRASNSVLSIKCENGFVRMGDWLFTEWSDKVPSEAEEKVIMYDSELKIHERE